MKTAKLSFEKYHSRNRESDLVALLKAIHPIAFRVANQVLKHTQDSEDTAQDVLLKAVKEVQRIKDFQHFDRWVYRVSLNAALDKRKSQIRRKRREETLAIEADTNRPRGYQEIYENLESLHDQERQVIMAHYMGGYTLKELGKQMGCSHATVSNRLTAAVSKLRRSLRDGSSATAAATVVAALFPTSSEAAPAFTISERLQTAIESVSTPVATSSGTGFVATLLSLWKPASAAGVIIAGSYLIWSQSGGDSDGVDAVRESESSNYETAQIEPLVETRVSSKELKEANENTSVIYKSLKEELQYLLDSIEVTPSEPLRGSRVIDKWELDYSLFAEHPRLTIELLLEARNWLGDDSLNASFVNKFSGRSVYFSFLDHIQAVAYRAWSEKDPADAFARLTETDNYPGRQTLIYLFENWAQVDIDAATEAALKMNEDYREHSLQSIAGTMMIESPENALVWVKTLPKEHRVSMIEKVLKISSGLERQYEMFTKHMDGLRANDPSTIKELASQGCSPEEFVRLADEFFETTQTVFKNIDNKPLSDQLYETILSWDDPVLDESLAEQFHRSYVSELVSESNFTAALDALASVNESSSRNKVYIEILKDLAQHEPGDAYQRILKKQVQGDLSFPARIAVSEMSESNPALAAEWFIELSENKVWSETPSEQFAAGSDELQSWMFPIEAIVNGWSSVDFEALSEWVVRLPNERMYENALEHMATNLWESDPDDAVSQVLEWEHSEVKDRILNHFVIQKTQEDIQGAYQFIKDNNIQSPLVLGTIAKRMALTDITLAATIAETLPVAENSKGSIELGRTYELSHLALHEVASEWARQDNHRAIDWVHSLESIAQREIATLGIIDVWAKKEPLASFEWAESVLETDTLKGNVASNIARIWHSTDPVGMRGWYEADKEVASPLREFAASLLR